MLTSNTQCHQDSMASVPEPAALFCRTILEADAKDTPCP